MKPRLNRAQREALRLLLRHGKVMAGRSKALRRAEFQIAPLVSVPTARSLVRLGFAEHESNRGLLTGVVLFPTMIAKRWGALDAATPRRPPPANHMPKGPYACLEPTGQICDALDDPSALSPAQIKAAEILTRWGFAYAGPKPYVDCPQKISLSTARALVSKGLARIEYQAEPLKRSPVTRRQVCGRGASCPRCRAHY
jgi:hypothetical protein